LRAVIVPFIAALKVQAPRIRVRVVPVEPERLVAQLEQGNQVNNGLELTASGRVYDGLSIYSGVHPLTGEYRYNLTFRQAGNSE
jgi:hypothetical protein